MPNSSIAAPIPFLQSGAGKQNELLLAPSIPLRQLLARASAETLTQSYAIARSYDFGKCNEAENSVHGFVVAETVGARIPGFKEVHDDFQVPHDAYPQRAASVHQNTTARGRTLESRCIPQKSILRRIVFQSGTKTSHLAQRAARGPNCVVAATRDREVAKHQMMRSERDA